MHSVLSGRAARAAGFVRWKGQYGNCINRSAKILPGCMTKLLYQMHTTDFALAQAQKTEVRVRVRCTYRRPGHNTHCITPGMTLRHRKRRVGRLSERHDDRIISAPASTGKQRWHGSLTALLCQLRPVGCAIAQAHKTNVCTPGPGSAREGPQKERSSRSGRPC